MFKKVFAFVCCIFLITLNATAVENQDSRVVVFDFGGVIAKADTAQMASFLTTTFNVNKEELYTTLKAMQNFVAKGGSEETFWQQYADSKGVTLPDDWFFQFGTVINNSIHEIPGTLSIVKALQEQGYQTAMLSDVTPYQAKIIRNLGYYDFFDPAILSCEISVNKPDPKAYQILIQRLNVPASSLFFTDDRIENVEAAKEQGIDAVKFLNPNQLKEELLKRDFRLPNALQ